MIRRFDVYLVRLDPTRGAEMKKTRPAVVVSPDELNRHLSTVVVVPLTSGRPYPFRISTHFRGTTGVAAIDQIRTVDKSRLSRRVGAIDAATGATLLGALVEMFGL